MTRFPLLRLPELAQINMLRQVELVDLVTLSFCSHKAKKLVSLAKVRLDELTLNLFDSHFLIVVNRTFRVYYSSLIPIVLLTCFDHPKPVDLFETSESPGAVASFFIGHLMDTFRKIKNISVLCVLDDMLTLPIWNYRTTIGDLVIFKKDMKTANEEVMNSILNTLTVTGHFDFHPTVAVGYQYSNGFQQEGVRIYHADWVHFDAVLHSRSRYICLYGVPLPPATQFQTFLKLWMDKTHMDNLEFFGMRKKGGGFTDSFCQQIVNEIEHERVAPRTIKVQRIDGKVAKVNMSKNYFRFRVL